MLLDTDQEIVKETIQHSQEYTIAKALHGLVENERFMVYNTFDHGSEFGISIEYDTYHYGHLASYIDRFIEFMLCQMSSSPVEKYIYVTNLRNPDDLNEEFQLALQKIYEKFPDYRIIPLHL